MSAKPARAYADPKANARKYSNPAGDRVNVSYIIARKGVSASEFQTLRRWRWAALGNKRVASYPERVPNHFRTENTFREADVDAVLAEWSNPGHLPPGQITADEAIRILGSEWVFVQARRSGNLRRVGDIPGPYPGRRRPLFDRKRVEKLAAEREAQQSPPDPDCLTASAAARQFGIPKPTVLRWKRDCPTLQQGIGIRRRGKEYVSKKKLERCLRLRESPEEGKCPGNLGAWTDREVYEEAGRTLVTLVQLEATFGWPRRLVRYWLGYGKSAGGRTHVPGGLSLRCQLVQRPSRFNPHGGEVLVVDLDDARKVKDQPRRAPGRPKRTREEGAAPTAEPSSLKADPRTPLPETPAPRSDETEGRPRRRGRPKGTIDAAAQDRNRRMIEDYRAGRYESVAELFRAYHMTRGRASQILAAAGGRER